MALDFSKVFRWTTYFDRSGSKSEDRESILKMHGEARRYLESFAWCTSVTEEYVGMIYPGIVAVFLFQIQPSRKEVDDWVWVVVGDLPPAYITCEESPNPATALDSYIGAMEEWVDAVDRGTSTDELIPVNVPATQENAVRLRKRLKQLDNSILSGYAEDLKAK